MVGKRKSGKKATYPTKRKVGRGSTRPRTTRRSFGSVIQSGVRTVLGYLPGGPIAQSFFDFACKLFLASTNIVITESEGVKTLTINNPVSYGSFGYFMVTPVSLMGSMPLAGCVTPNSLGRYDSSTIHTHFVLARILSFKVIARPTAPSGMITGMWAIGLTPSRAAEDTTSSVLSKDEAISISTIRQMPYYSEGFAGSPLVLNVRFGVRDGDIFTEYRKIDAPRLTVFYAYENLSVSSSVSAVPSFETSGRIQFTPDASGTILKTENKIYTKTSDYSAIVRDVKEGKSYKITNCQWLLTSGIPQCVATLVSALQVDPGDPELADLDLGALELASPTPSS